MSTIPDDLKPEKGDYDEASTTLPSPMERSRANSPDSTRKEVEVDEKQKDVEPQEDGGPLEPVESAMYPGPLRLIPILIAICLSVFLMALDMTIVATAIPHITDEFHSLNDVGWYGSAFFLTLAAFQSTWGKAYKYFHLKWTFMVSNQWAKALPNFGSGQKLPAPPSFA